MGCCFSTNKSTPPQKAPHISNSKTTAKHSSISKSPPPPPHPLLEEEAVVKEVLSETTSSVPKRPSPAAVKTESPFIKSAPLLQDFSGTANGKEHRNGGVCKKPFAAMGADDLSEVSEICSTLSESVSASTTLTEKRESKDELRQRSPARFKNRSFSGDVNKDKAVGRSPGRRPEPSPSRVRPVPGPAYGRGRDGSEGSGRRSRSPAARTDSGQSRSGLGRTQSARKTGRSPGRVGSGLGDRIRRVDGGKECGDSKWPPTATNDSLENPLVSLECFIFL